MRKPIAGVLTLGLALLFTTDVSVGSDARSQPGWRTVPVTAWSLTDVGVGARSLFITYVVGSSSCDRPATAQAIETETTIRVRLRKREYVGPDPCTSDLVIGTIRVRLHQPVAGRAVMQPKHGPGGHPCRFDRRGDCQSIIPRVIGLNPNDARRVVLDDGLQPKFSSNNNPPDPGSLVTDQSPKPHTLRRVRTVTIFTVAPG